MTHWLLGEETHFGRGYFSLSRFNTKADALKHARTEYGLNGREHAELRLGRVDFFSRPGRAQEVGCIALELVGCECETPEVHDG